MSEIIIATHSVLAESLHLTATMICGSALTEHLHLLSLKEDGTGIFGFEEQAKRLLGEITGNDIIILTDLYGASPFNVCCSLFHKEHHKIVTGVNLPMVMEILLSNETSDLLALSQKAEIAGKSGICVMDMNVLQQENEEEAFF